MKDSTDTPIRVGIAGLGRTGWRNHAFSLEYLKDKFKIVAVADPSPARQAEAAERFGCRAYGDFDSLVSGKDVEVMVVATPNLLHREQSIKALEAGMHVVCEKPFCPTVADADAMFESARKVGRVLIVFQSRRYALDFLKVRQVRQSGKLGRIVLIRIASHAFTRRWDWQTLKKCGGGLLGNYGAHYIDQALLLMGHTDPDVFCHMEHLLASGDAEDHVKVILRAEGAPMIDVEISSACAYPQAQWLVMGTSGGLTGSAKELRWKYVDLDLLPPRPVDTAPTPDRSYNREDLPWQEETWRAPESGPPMAAPFYLDLYETLRHGAPLAVTPESVRRQLVVLEKCRKLCPV